jgi:3-hydroxyisobutyrate dehydrogenase-like beta-hydroxyacid dehydrogenase
MDSPTAVATASVVFTMVVNPDDVCEVILDLAVGVLAGLRPSGVLVDCTSSSPTPVCSWTARARPRTDTSISPFCLDASSSIILTLS